MEVREEQEADVIRRIEELELEARAIRGDLQGLENESDRQVLQEQLRDTENQIDLLRRRLPRGTT